MQFIKEKLLKLLFVLGLYPDGAPTWVSYVTFLLGSLLIWGGGTSSIWVLVVCKILTLLAGVMVVLIVRRIIRGFLPRVFISSGILIALLTFLAAWRYYGQPSEAVNNGELIFSWWGLFLYIPFIWSLLKMCFGSLIRMVYHNYEAHNRLRGWNPTFVTEDGRFYQMKEKQYDTVGGIKNFFQGVGYFILLAVMLSIIFCLFYYGMYSLMIVRAVAELIRIMNKLVPENKI